MQNITKTLSIVALLFTVGCAAGSDLVALPKTPEIDPSVLVGDGSSSIETEGKFYTESQIRSAVQCYVVHPKPEAQKQGKAYQDKLNALGASIGPERDSTLKEIVEDIQATQKSFDLDCLKEPAGGADKAKKPASI